VIPSIRLVLFAVLFVLPLHAAPDVQEIIRRLIEQSEDSGLSNQRKSVAYQRTSRVEYLEEDGKVKRDVIRIYKVFPEDGKSVTRLVSVNGNPPKDKSDKKRSAARETGEKSRGLAISRDLLARYHFTFVREEEFAHRRAFVLSFTAKKDAPNEEFFDKLINSMAGTLWIDQEDYQLAKADIRLAKRVAFFGGLAGAIEKLDLTLIQRRIEPSLWLGEAIHIDFAGRKLFSPTRFRCFENCSGFEKVSTEHARADLSSILGSPSAMP
jgi:hypothetical protein